MLSTPVTGTSGLRWRCRFRSLGIWIADYLASRFAKWPKLEIYFQPRSETDTQAVVRDRHRDRRCHSPMSTFEGGAVTISVVIVIEMGSDNAADGGDLGNHRPI